MRKINLEGKEFIVYGKKKFIPKNFRKIKNHKYWIKPYGGLWASPINSRYGWKNFILSEMPMWNNKLQSYFKFKLKPNSKIYIINSIKDLHNIPFIKKAGEYSVSETLIDFEKMKEKGGYDGIFLTAEGQFSTRMPEFKGIYYQECHGFNLYGWDVESLLVFNKNCIVPVNKFPRIRLHKGRNNWKKNAVIARTSKSMSEDDPEILEWKNDEEYNSVIVERGSTYKSKKSFIRALRKLQYKIGDDPTSKFILR